MPEARLERTRKAYEIAVRLNWATPDTIYALDGEQVDVPFGWTGEVRFPDRTVRYLNGLVVK